MVLRVELCGAPHNSTPNTSSSPAKKCFAALTQTCVYPREIGIPDDIPSAPARTYREIGWKGFSHWLSGEDRVLFLSFDAARALARSLRLSSTVEWRSATTAADFPRDVPRSPDRHYAKTGWKGWSDWLGVRIRSKVQIRPFHDAREYARSLGLKNRTGWERLARARSLPNDVPHKPSHVYKTNGWVGWGDWLGAGTLAPRFRKYRSFREARAFGRSLSLTSQKQWFACCKSSELPRDIPTNPASVFKDKGWLGWSDWLGTDTKPKSKRASR